MPSCPVCRTRYPEGAAHCAQDGAALLDDAAFSNVDRDLLPGDVVGEYRIDGKIGEGGFGSVYAATHPLIGKRAALKTLHRQHSSNPQIVARFIAEAKAVNQIRHRNIIDIFSFGSLPDGRQYFLMELLEGRTFEDYFRAKGKLTIAEALPILRGVARALDAAHAKGIAHRDLKPENVYLVTDENGAYTAKLLDFGVAKLSVAEEGGVKTRTGVPIGTPYYMSPEQARGQSVDFRTDIYALGVVCFQVLTGQVPFNGTSLMDLMVAHASKPPPRMSDIDPSIPRALDAPVLHMLAKEAADRPQSVGAAVDELEAAANNSDAPSSRLSNTLPAPGEMSGPPSHARTNDPLAVPGTSLSSTGGGGPKSRSSMIAIALGGVLAAGLAVVAVVQLRTAPKVAATPPTTSSSAETATTATPAPSPAAESAKAPPTPPPVASALVVVTTTPNGAIVSRDGTVLGPAPGPFAFTAGPEKVTLRVTAPGYQPGSVDVVPGTGAAVAVTLKKAAPSRAAISRDLDDPFKK